jgi:hypothetical protein
MEEKMSLMIGDFSDKIPAQNKSGKIAATHLPSDTALVTSTAVLSAKP